MATGQGWTYDAAGNVITDGEGRQFSYDAENKQREVKDSLNQTIGQYFFDGDGKRVEKIVPGTGEVTIFVYDAGGKLIGEYSTIVETQAPKVKYLTNDHLASPRINTDQNGLVTSRTDYMPYGEEIIALGNRTTNENYVEDDVRQGFTGYENDAETELNYAIARMQNPSLGRFHSPDPLYFQETMVLDPQLFNLFVYVKNNPVRLIDPTGESVRVRGQNTIAEFQEMVGGEEEFERYFILDGDYILLRDGVDLSEANEGVRFLAGLVEAPEMYLFYHGNDFGEIADLFDGAFNDKGKLTRYGQDLKRKFEGRTRGQRPHIGSIVAVYGRPSGIQPGSINGTPLFAIIAVNSDIPIIQTGIGTGDSRNRMLESFSDGGGIIAPSAQASGIFQRVSAASYFIHEGAEAQTFKRIGFVDFRGKPNYRRAHSEAMRIEARIREAIELTGGFAGGAVAREQ
ncbi:RHS repeat domain-containing protein [Leptolyngbya sp. 7M]|uniref:RHS repeat domain-containing protein n=1 Tax=Leptolyngbya sp. 7M TaxID=2812896 RepID=UPI001B8ACCD5|nr:RHS repeat-associated core domain-containing protein [Leptolyngbya sp. 7M]QYO67996.1 RHS repeat-associated core domain-containing protein [Leptolyngbya sp. 7M]